MPDPRPQLEAAAEHAYALLEPLAGHDPTSGWPLARLVAGLTSAIEPTWRLVEAPGLAQALHPATVAPAWLPLLAQPAGAVLTGGMTVDQQRAEVTSPSGARRGLPAHLAEVAAPYLRSLQRMTVRQRTNPARGTGEDDPGHIQILVHRDDVRPEYLTGSGPTLDAPALRRALIDDVPAWLRGHVSITDERDYAAMRATYPTYGGAKTANTDYADLLDAS